CSSARTDSGSRSTAMTQPSAPSSVASASVNVPRPAPRSAHMPGPRGTAGARNATASASFTPCFLPPELVGLVPGLAPELVLRARGFVQVERLVLVVDIQGAVLEDPPHSIIVHSPRATAHG